MSQSLDLALVKFWENSTPPQPTLVAVSGGPDSLALLDILLRQKPRFPALRLEVAHFNHHIRGRPADLDAHFVEEFCQTNQLPFHLGQFDVPAFAAAYNLSLEDAARQARYAWLQDLASRLDIKLVLTGHNADDQVETVLLRLVRGTGPHGLAGMDVLTRMPPPHPALITAFPQAGSNSLRLGRPFLAVWRKDIEAYCRENCLEPRQDETNLEVNYARNRVRHQLLPFLESEYQPQIKANLSRLAGLARQDEEWLGQLVEAEFWQNARFEFGCQLVFSREYLLRKPVALQKRLLRHAARLLGGLQNIDAAHIEAILEFFKSEEARRMDLPGRLVAFAGKSRVGLLAVAEPANWPQSGLQLVIPGSLTGPTGWRLSANLLTGTLERDFFKEGDAYHVFLDYAKINTPLRLRPRQVGERYRPLGSPGQRKVQDIMLDAGIPRELRRDWPVLVSPGNTELPDAICWIPGAPTAHNFRVTPETKQILELQFEFGTTPQTRNFDEAREDYLNGLKNNQS